MLITSEEITSALARWIRNFQTESEVRKIKNKTTVKVTVEDITGKELLNFFVVSKNLKDDRSLAYAIRDAIKKTMPTRSAELRRAACSFYDHQLATSREINGIAM